MWALVAAKRAMGLGSLGPDEVKASLPLELKLAGPGIGEEALPDWR